MGEFFSSILPPASSTIADDWNQLFWFLMGISAVFFAVVMIPMTIFVIKYRKRPGRKSEYIDRNEPLEILWTAIPTVVVMVIFAWGWIVYRDMVVRIPSNAMEIRVLAKSWSWTFQYDDGRIENNRVFVPVNRDIRLVMTSDVNDVLHSFFVPNFRVKQDVVPGLYTNVYFRAKDVGRHMLYCTEYCGLGHSAMFGEVIVLSEKDWELWKWGKEIPLPNWVGHGGLAEQMLATQAESDGSNRATAKAAPAEDLAASGQKITQQMGCVACHSADGKSGIGPTFKNMFGTQRPLASGETVLADENYIRESIEFPQAKIVAGFENMVMPPYPGQLTALELNALVGYIKSLKE